MSSKAKHSLRRRNAENASHKPRPETTLPEADLRALTARLISTREEEGKRIARELHDVFSQRLARLAQEVMSAQRQIPRSAPIVANKLTAIAESIRRVAGDVHQLSRQIHPTILNDLGLTAALQAECSSVTDLYGIRVNFTATTKGQDLPESIQLCVYRVVQELLHNVLKHASKTKKVRIKLERTARKVHLYIQDFGYGFDLARLKRKGGLGLVSIEERLRMVNGILTIDSKPGRGTKVLVDVPVSQEAT
jgi:signal transduction histidine kinase